MIDFIPAPASLPPGQRVYAIGDVHGCLDRLEAMHGLIAEDLAARPTTGAVLVHLGDYVDRGPDSAGVVARLAAGNPLPDVPTVNLMGNHEHMMLAALATGETEMTELWLANGGADSLQSWKVPRSAQPKEWPSYLPMPHLMFLRDLALRHEVGGYLFVHAGIRPGIPLDRQSRHDLMWIREPFLSWNDVVRCGGGARAHAAARAGGAAQPDRHRHRRRDGWRADLCRTGRGQAGVHHRVRLPRP